MRNTSGGHGVKILMTLTSLAAPAHLCCKADNKLSLPCNEDKHSEDGTMKYKHNLRGISKTFIHFVGNSYVSGLKVFQFEMSHSTLSQTLSKSITLRSPVACPEPNLSHKRSERGC